jgi:hypothetical protein
LAAPKGFPLQSLARPGEGQDIKQALRPRHCPQVACEVQGGAILRSKGKQIFETCFENMLTVKISCGKI